MCISLITATIKRNRGTSREFSPRHPEDNTVGGSGLAINFPAEMETVFDDVVPAEDLKKFEKQYNQQFDRGFVNPKTKFEYAWCLVRSKYAVDIEKGVHFLRELVKNGEEDAKRDYLFYLAIGQAKLKDYSEALRHIRMLLSVEPTNTQAKDLEKVIKKKMEREGLMGMAIVGGAALALGAVVGLGFALAKK